MLHAAGCILWFRRVCQAAAHTEVHRVQVLFLFFLPSCAEWSFPLWPLVPMRICWAGVSSAIMQGRCRRRSCDHTPPRSRKALIQCFSSLLQTHLAGKTWLLLQGPHRQWKPRHPRSCLVHSPAALNASTDSREGSSHAQVCNMLHSPCGECRNHKLYHVGLHDPCKNNDASAYDLRKQFSSKFEKISETACWLRDARILPIARLIRTNTGVTMQNSTTM